jgi:hypothetical protein
MRCDYDPEIHIPLIKVILFAPLSTKHHGLNAGLSAFTVL